MEEGQGDAAELDRLEKLLQAEHQKIMGGLALLPPEEAASASTQGSATAVHQEWLDQQASEASGAVWREEHEAVLRSTHEQWLAHNSPPPPAEEELKFSEDAAAQEEPAATSSIAVDAEVSFANDLVARRMEAEMAQLQTLVATNDTSTGPLASTYAAAAGVTRVPYAAETETETPANDPAAAAWSFPEDSYTAATAGDIQDEGEYEYRQQMQELPGTPTQLAVRMSRRIPMEDATSFSTEGQPEAPGSPYSAESDGSGGSMAAVQTSLESLAELEALLEEQHKQLIARGLIPADTPNNGS